uniref:DDE Tnp4 domain-containing protein n=1 Tax=Myripristis murdjan TaxID=586833 RepID=A0A667Z7W3_9TELE
MVYLLLSLWLFVGVQRREANQRRLQAAWRNAQEKHRKVLEAKQRYDEEDRRRRARRRMRVMFSRASQWWDSIVPGFMNAQWVENFRMSEETLGFLCNKLRPAMEREDPTFRESVLKKRVAIALSISHLFGVSVTTVCRCVQDFCAAAETLLVPEQIRLPDEGRFRDMAAYMENRWGLPHCVGAIDGSHIPIIVPQQYHTDYFNHKGWHSLILQAVVDGKGKFWNVFAGLPGSLHDARVLRLSTLNIGAVTAGYYILGNSAYPLQKWLLKPFHDTGRLTAEQHMFNHKFSRAQVVVENAFGRLKGRWRCLLKRKDCDTQLVKSMVLTCCALHNLCEEHGESYEASWDAPDTAECEPVAAAAQGVEEQGRDVRNALMQYFSNNA